MTINICRLMRDFPSLKGIEQVATPSAFAEEIEYAEYGLAPGIYSLMKEQVKLGASFNVIAAKREGVADHESLEGIEVHRVGKSYNMNTLLKIRELDSSVGIDIVHAHATSAFVYALFRPFTGKKPYVVHVHGTTAGVQSAFKSLHFSIPNESMKDKFRTWLSLKRQKMMWKRADLLIAVSKNIAEELETFYGIPREKVCVVHNGVDINVFKPADEELRLDAQEKLGIRGNPFVLFVGHLSPRKGLHYLLEAVPKVVKKFPEALFVIVGGSPDFVGRRNYQQIWSDMVSRLGVSRNVCFAGEVRHRDTLDYYWSSDAFVFPTIYEGLAKALLEAMACGVPVVTTNAGGNSEAVTHEETGILTAPSSSEELAEALIRILSDQSAARNMGLRARKRVEKNFTWEATARKIMIIYEELLESLG